MNTPDDRDTVLRRTEERRPESPPDHDVQGEPGRAASAQPPHSHSPEPIEETLDPSAVDGDDDATIFRPRPPRIEASAVRMPDKLVRLATYRPRRLSKGTIALGIAVIACVAAITVVLVAGRHTRHAVRTVRTGSRGQLVVRRVSISTDPSVPALHCPTQQITYTATVFTNGRSGVLVYRWTTPSGSNGLIYKTPLLASETAATDKLRFTFHDPANGVATFHILRPTPSDTPSPFTTYACP